MSRLVAPDKPLTQLDVSTESRKFRYVRKNDGTFHVENPNHARQMKAEGFIEASLLGNPKASGFPCACGFSSFFAVCSRCGTNNG